MKRKNFSIILSIFVYVFTELLSYAGLSIVDSYFQIQYRPVDTLSINHRLIIKRFIKQNTNYFVFDSDLGWTISANGSTHLYRSNSIGIRSNREYTPAPSPDVVRIAAFGDSFTHCANVSNQETWQVVMERTDPHIEALNFGVDAYGLDQAYLRYLKLGKKYQPDIVIIGFMPENLKRNVNTFRPFYFSSTNFPFAKPRFIVKDKALSLITIPMRKSGDYENLLQRPRKVLSALGNNDHYYKNHYKSTILDYSPFVRLVTILSFSVSERTMENPIIFDNIYNQNSEAYLVTIRLIDAFYDAVIENGSLPIIAILPANDDVSNFQKQGIKQYSPLLSYLRARNYNYVDLMDVLGNVDTNLVFDGHYSSYGNELVARHILSYIDNRKFKPKR